MSGQTRESRSTAGLSKLSSVNHVEVDVILGELVSGRHHHGRAASGVKRSGIPRKEVIQPQLPLRLPCYDFTPVTDPTFDDFLPYGIKHRPRSLTASLETRAVCMMTENNFASE